MYILSVTDFQQSSLLALSALQCHRRKISKLFSFLTYLRSKTQYKVLEALGSAGPLFLVRAESRGETVNASATSRACSVADGRLREVRVVHDDKVAQKICPLLE